MFIELPMVREAEMGLWNGKAMADRFAAYIGELTKVVGHADRAGPLRDYCSGLLVTEGRRSAEPMAAVTAPARVSAQHQKLLHFAANSTWSDEEMLTKVRELVRPALERHGPIQAYDKARRAEAHVPGAIRFKTKPQMALEQIRGALKAGVARGVLLMDASYGTNSALRLAITELGLCYVAAIISTVKV